ncbi:MAG: hypothetical protein M0Q01_03895 [Syntrophales bacterium]|jgi:hypothetical protein|nr:hypothetical protein [Syntrophales bacterium]
MMTNNLQEMIQPKRNNDFEYVDFDPYDTMPDKKDDLATEIIASEASILPIKMPEIPDSNYQPETEEALIDYVVSQNNKLEVATIFVKWKIGRSIKSFYQGKYGAHELDKISEATGITKDNLNKMIKFAGQYNQEQLNALIKGSFAISWNGIAQNLAIKPEKLIEVYEKAGNINEFNRELIKSKDPGETRGKVKPPKSIEAPALDVEQPEQPEAVSTEITVALIPEKVAEKPIIDCAEIITDEPSLPTENDESQESDIEKTRQDLEQCSKDLEYFKFQNEGLWKELANTKQKFSELYRAIDEHLRKIEEKDIIIRKYRERFKRLRYMIEDGYSADEIIELLAAVE